MKIDKKLLDEQIGTFRVQREECVRNLGMMEGAIQAIDHLLKVLDMKEPPKEEISELNDILPPGVEVVDRTSNEKGEKHGMAKGKETGKQKATGSYEGSG